MKTLLTGIFIIAIALFLAGCAGQQNTIIPTGQVVGVPGPAGVNGSDGETGATGSTGETGETGETEYVAQTSNTDIVNMRFSDVTIKTGDTVTWTNQDTEQHTVSSDSGNELNSPVMENGQTYSHTFTVAGTYTYHCSIHPSMKARVTVED